LAKLARIGRKGGLAIGIGGYLTLKKGFKGITLFRNLRITS